METPFVSDTESPFETQEGSKYHLRLGRLDVGQVAIHHDIHPRGLHASALFQDSDSVLLYHQEFIYIASTQTASLL